MSEMSDTEFLDYVYYHSETDRALFSNKHVARLLTLAQDPRADDFAARDGFTAVYQEVAKPLVEKARAHMRKS